MERFELDAGLARAACDRLGVALPASMDDVAALYRAWTAVVPFDPVAKMAAVREGRTPPGDDPSDLLERWLTTGVGGTCWGHCSSLAGVIGAGGARCTVGLDRMVTDDKVDFHSFTVVHDGERRLALDPVHPSGRPLPLAPGAIGDHGVYQVGIDEVDGRWEHWFTHPETSSTRVAYAVLSLDLDRADVRAFCKVSSRYSGVRGARLRIRWCPPGGLSTLGVDDDAIARLRRWRAGAPAVDEVTFDDSVAALRAAGFTDGSHELVVRAGFARRDGRGRLELVAPTAPPP